MKRLIGTGLVALFLSAAGAIAAPFTAGNLVVLRYGDGVNSYTSGTAAPTYLDEFTTGGVSAGNTIAMPINPGGGNFTLTGSVTSTSMGALTLSGNGRFLTLFGFDAPIGASTPSSNASYRGRTVGIVNQYGGINTTTRFEAAGTSPRSAVSTNGTDIWLAFDGGSGNVGGPRYVTKGSTTTGNGLTDGSSFTYNVRVANIYNNQLYYSTSSGTAGGSWRGVNALGSGLPTSGAQAGTVVVGGGASGAGPVDSAYDFFFGDSNTLYVADDDASASVITGGLQKWIYSGGAWSKAWTIIPSGSVGLRGLTGAVDGQGNVVLYGITAESSGTAQNKLVSVSDTLAGLIAPAGFSVLATSPANTVFRGVDFAPTPEPGSIALLAGAIAFAAMRRTRRD